MERRWFLAYGPDSRHLHNVEVFEKARDAKAAYEVRDAKAKQLFSLDFEPWDGGKNKRVLRERIS
jgi:hypothetical protein